MSWTPPRLDGTVAVVTGASRGVGKGIALALGEAGAEVWVTGRSTVEETAAEVTDRGGRGVAARTDHRDDAQVEALFERVRRDAGRLDIVVANAWGGYEGHDHQTFGAPFWEQPLSRWESMFDAGLRMQFTTARFAAPLHARAEVRADRAHRRLGRSALLPRQRAVRRLEGGDGAARERARARAASTRCFGGRRLSRVHAHGGGRRRVRSRRSGAAAGDALARIRRARSRAPRRRSRGARRSAAAARRPRRTPSATASPTSIDAPSLRLRCRRPIG